MNAIRENRTCDTCEQPGCKLRYPGGGCLFLTPVCSCCGQLATRSVDMEERTEGEYGLTVTTFTTIALCDICEA